MVLSTLLFFQNCSQVAFDVNQYLLTKSEAANTPIDPGSNGGEPTSSDTCEDYSLRGWASKKTVCRMAIGIWCQILKLNLKPILMRALISK